MVRQGLANKGVTRVDNGLGSKSGQSWRNENSLRQRVDDEGVVRDDEIKSAETWCGDVADEIRVKITVNERMRRERHR